MQNRRTSGPVAEWSRSRGSEVGVQEGAENGGAAKSEVREQGRKRARERDGDQSANIKVQSEKRTTQDALRGHCFTHYARCIRRRRSSVVKWRSLASSPSTFDQRRSSRRSTSCASATSSACSKACRSSQKSLRGQPVFHAVGRREHAQGPAPEATGRDLPGRFRNPPPGAVAGCQRRCSVPGACRTCRAAGNRPRRALP